MVTDPSPPPALPRRSFLVGAAACLATAGSTRAQAPGTVVLHDFHRPGDPDDTLALMRALETGRPVHASAGRGHGPGGRYWIGTGEHDNLPTQTRLSGDGAGRTIIALSQVGAAPFILHADSKSADPARNLTGLRFSDLTFEDDVQRRGFSEFSYLVMLSGVSDAVFERVTFRGFRGDGLHLGSSTVSRVERHNRDVIVRDCLFDGVNSNNRNAISVIDCEGLIVERSSFLNCTRTGDGTANPGDPMNPLTGVAMPGAIDFEPNGDAFARIRRVSIRDNLFRGGGGYAVALTLMTNDQVRLPQSDITIARNVIEDRAGGIMASGYQGARALDAVPGYKLTITQNEVRRCARPFTFSGMKGVTLTGNSFTDCTDRAEIGNTAEVDDIELRDNRFTRMGSNTVRFALWIRGSRNVRLIGNVFEDAGGPDGKGGFAIAVVGGVTRGLQLVRNRFDRRLGRTSEAVTVFRDGQVDAGSLKVAENTVSFTAPAIEAALLKR